MQPLESDTKPPRTVGSPTEYADAEEMPGCVQGCVTFIFGIPILLLEIPAMLLEGILLIVNALGVVQSIIAGFVILSFLCVCIFSLVM